MQPFNKEAQQLTLSLLKTPFNGLARFRERLQGFDEAQLSAVKEPHTRLPLIFIVAILGSVPAGVKARGLGNLLCFVALLIWGCTVCPRTRSLIGSLGAQPLCPLHAPCSGGSD
jgi:hypothetical protein